LNTLWSEDSKAEDNIEHICPLSTTDRQTQSRHHRTLNPSVPSAPAARPDCHSLPHSHCHPPERCVDIHDNNTLSSDEVRHTTHRIQYLSRLSKALRVPNLKLTAMMLVHTTQPLDAGLPVRWNTLRFPSRYDPDTVMLPTLPYRTNRRRM